MEKITLTYNFDYEDQGETRQIVMNKQAEDGIHDYEVCELFMDFMRSVGYSEENVEKFFQ